MRVYLGSLGCRLNQCERDMLAQQFVQAGHVVVEQAQDAQICVLNTCAVTHIAVRKSRQRLEQLRRLNPIARWVVTGCSAGLAGSGLCADLVVENGRKAELVSLVEASAGPWGIGEGLGLSEAIELPPTLRQRRSGRTRPLVKIQDGCDNACAYCIVHILRGRQRSRPRGEVLAEVATLVRQGYREVVLTGVHIGSYGRDSGDSLTDLVQALLDEPVSPDRLRLSSIEPWDLAPDFFDLWRDPRLCRYLHLPLQSGCDATLRRMNRNYTSAQFAALVGQARRAIPDLAITTDLIVGLPGETEDEFAQSAAFVERMAFARTHIFSYSERPGTPAATMPDQVNPDVRRRRAGRMQEIARRSSEAFRRRFLGSTLPVLWETRKADGRWSGLTDNYIRVFTQSELDLSNALLFTRLVECESDGVRGELLEEPGVTWLDARHSRLMECEHR